MDDPVREATAAGARFRPAFDAHVRAVGRRAGTAELRRRIGAALERRAGRCLPLSRLDLELWSPDGGRIGLLARLRDVLPGRYSFGVTGRDPTGRGASARGEYELRLIAYGTDDRRRRQARTLRFTIK